MINLHQKTLGAIAAAAIACVVSLAEPAMAADTAPTAQAGTTKDPVEAQITRLHNQLHITPAQAEQFNAVAQIMRDNRTAHADLVKEKRQKEATMTAVEDLQAYAQIAQSHADAVKKLSAAFETLYGSLSDSQKKAADEVFRQHKRRVMRRAMQKAQ